MTRALIVVDAQRDFCEGGSLPVQGGNRVCVAIADCIRSYGASVPYPTNRRYQYVVGTKDFHLPADSNGGHIAHPHTQPNYIDTWPPHCIQGTEGSQFHPEIADVAWGGFNAVFYKGMGRPDYSGFQGTAPSMYPENEIHLLDWLNRRNVTELDIVGLAADFCVKATALDAIQFGFKVRVPVALTAAVGGDEAKLEAIRQINAAQGLDGALIN